MLLSNLLGTILWILDTVLYLYTYVIIAAVVVSWLIAFGVLNLHNLYARRVLQFLDAATEPVFRRIRKIIPPIGGLDLSPLVLLIAITAVRILIAPYIVTYPGL